LAEVPAATVTLGGVGDAAALAEAAGPDGIHVTVDYLWGPPTEAAITAITRRGLAHTAPWVRLVEVGQMAGPTIALPAEVLRSSGLEVLGGGPGAIPLTEIIAAIPQVMAIAADGDPRLTSPKSPSPRSRRPGSVAAAGGSSCGLDHRPLYGQDKPSRDRERRQGAAGQAGGRRRVTPCGGGAVSCTPEPAAEKAAVAPSPGYREGCTT
jgi:hypothetical protein